MVEKNKTMLSIIELKIKGDVSMKELNGYVLSDKLYKKIDEEYYIEELVDEDMNDILDGDNICSLEDGSMYYLLGEGIVICKLIGCPSTCDSEFSRIDGLGIYVATGNGGFYYAGEIDGSGGEFEAWMYDYYEYNENENLKHNMEVAIFDEGVDGECDKIYYKLIEKNKSLNEGKVV